MAGVISRTGIQVHDGRRGNFVGEILQAGGEFSPHYILLADAVLDREVDGKPNLSRENGGARGY